MPSLPNPLIAAAADILSSHYYSHGQINNLFTQCHASGPPPEGNLARKITLWLTESPDWLDRRAKINRALATHGLSYGQGGHIIGGATGAPSRSLDSIIRERDLPAVLAEFDRALSTVERDPPAAVTAAGAIVES